LGGESSSKNSKRQVEEWRGGWGRLDGADGVDDPLLGVGWLEDKSKRQIKEIRRGDRADGRKGEVCCEGRGGRRS
jgi:hypothetical protein